jgi:hypothetical protein
MSTHKRPNTGSGNRLIAWINVSIPLIWNQPTEADNDKRAVRHIKLTAGINRCKFFAGEIHAVVDQCQLVRRDAAGYLLRFDNLIHCNDLRIQRRP